MPKLNPSTRFVLIVLIIGLGAYFGFKAWGSLQLAGFEPTPLKPGNISLVAFNTERTSGSNLRYRVIVANRVAQIIEESGEGGLKTSSGAGDSANTRRMPIKEMLGAISGDEEALSYFVSVVNDISHDELPPTEVIWTSEDIRAALSGNEEKIEALKQDLNVTLDGVPLTTINMSAINNGIVVLVEVPVEVEVAGVKKTLIAKVKKGYQPRFSNEFSNEMSQIFEPSKTELIGRYRAKARPLVTGDGDAENVRASLEALISDSRKRRLAEQPEQILQRIKVLANESLMTGAQLSSYKDEKGRPIFDLELGMTEDGRKRLWKYSRESDGFSLMLIVDGIAVAAPRVETELAQKTLQIKRLEDQGLAETTNERINELVKEQKTD